MNWIFTTLQWYFPIFVIGIIFFPLAHKIFGNKFPDLGYAFSKTLAILFVSYAVFVLGILKILPFSQVSILIITICFLIFNFYLYKRHSGDPDVTSGDSRIDSGQARMTLTLIVFEEFLFLAALFFWTFIRGQEPSVRGLEKFMDFGFINSILRSQHFPPLDMWLSKDQSSPNGNFINYYYFGHLTGAILIKLTGIKAAIGYNLILATLFALCITQSFSIVIAIIASSFALLKRTVSSIKLVFFGLLGSFIVSLAGNLHTMYLFTSGYPNESPVPFWNILSWYNPTKYWYPNATRFIPFTIHEFPSYSWVVADIHGHVFNIPFVLLTLAILFIFFIKSSVIARSEITKQSHKSKREIATLTSFARNDNSWTSKQLNNVTREQLTFVVFLGFLCAVHYMTNAFDGPIYLLLTALLFFVLYRFSKQFFISIGLLIGSFILTSLPFSLHFKPFVSGIGVNCSPQFLIAIKKLGPFIFEKGNCQLSPIWMLLILWGFFWISFLLFLIVNKIKNGSFVYLENRIDVFVAILFSFGTILLIIPEFFYIKDIYPAHFRANTMFKLGYQSFIMMSIASSYTFYRIKTLPKKGNRILSAIFIFFFFFIAIYPIFSIPSYYGQLDRAVELDGSKWLNNGFEEDKEIIEYINKNITGQPVILEAQGDSYTDYNLISAYTGVPTIAGWWVHEWLWRGSSNIVGVRISDIVTIYESNDVQLTKNILNKYQVKYIVVANMERQKYTNLNEDKINKIAKRIFTTSNHLGALYQVIF